MRKSTLVTTVALRLALVIGVSVGCRRSPVLEPADSRHASRVEGTRFDVRDQSFAIALPFGWTRVPPRADGPDVFQSADASEQLTVTSMSSDAPMPEAKRMETLRALVKHRQDAERQGMGAAMSAREPTISTSGGMAMARYDGIDPTAGHRFATLVLVAERGAWAAFLESPASTSEATFRRHATAIFDGFSIGH
jgi:hypothetical protein